MGRAPCCDKANVKKGPWSPEEDATLKSYIHKHGTGGNWIALPQKIGLKRCGKSCRLRWLNYLRPNIKHGGFTEDEDNLICSLYISIGSRWSIIAAQLPGRTDNDIKNYWNTKLKKKLFGKQRTRRSNPDKEGFSVPEQLAPPPFLVGYSNENQPTSNHLLMPHFDADFSYDHQVNNQEEIFEAQHQEMWQNSTCPRFESDFPFDSSLPQPLDALDGDGFTTIDVANSSTISSSSLENSSWGDISSIVYPSTVANYQEMPQYYCTLFDEPRLLGYSQ